MNTSKLVIALIAFLVPFAAFAQMEDPALIYQSSLPGYYIPHAREVAVDAAGCAYFIGSAYEDHHSLDVIVAKFDPQGSHVWTRYITGAGHCYATGLALDSGGNVWVTGWTDAADFPVLNAMDSTLTGFRDIFLMKLDPATGASLYSTFIGGDYTDAAEDIFINEYDEIFLTGYTGSTDFPVTADAYQAEPGFPEYFYQDAFITKLNPDGNTLLYSTYFGGTHDDTALEIGLDHEGNIIVAGTTNADDFPLALPFQSAPNELFVSKLSADGSQVLFSTYLGGEDLDRLTKMEILDSGDLVLTGITRSVYFPTTFGAYQEDFVGDINGCEVPFGADYNCEDIFVTKLATDGSGLVWSTYLGGSAVEESRDIAVGPDGAVYIAGYTGSADFPPSGMDFGAEIIVCRLDPSGQTLDYTYSVDSGSANRGNGIAVDSAGDIYFTGTVGVPASLVITKLGNRFTTPVPDIFAKVARLDANYPNPFNPMTRIGFTLAQDESVRLGVYDLKGHEVAVLVDDAMSAGPHEAAWTGQDSQGRPMPSGSYFYRLEAGRYSETRRMVLLR